MTTKKPPRERKPLEYRVRILPSQIDRARRRYQGLLREAYRLGLKDLLTGDELANLQEADRP